MKAANAPARWWLSLRWLAAVGLVFGIQWLLVFWVSDRVSPPSPKFPRAGGIYHLDAHQWRAENRLLSRDPSLLSRVHLRSFSGGLWDSVLDSEREYNGWTEAPQYYTGTQAATAAGEAKRSRKRNAIAPSVVSMPALALSEAERPRKLPKPASSILVAGDIQARLPEEYPPLCSWPRTNHLRPTVVAVAVDRFGWTRTAAVLSNSVPAGQLPLHSLVGADAYALDWVRQLRFQPLPPSSSAADADLAWGEITFHWAISPPAETLPTTNSP